MYPDSYWSERGYCRIAWFDGGSYAFALHFALSGCVCSPCLTLHRYALRVCSCPNLVRYLIPHSGWFRIVLELFYLHFVRVAYVRPTWFDVVIQFSYRVLSPLACARAFVVFARWGLTICYTSLCYPFGYSCPKSCLAFSLFAIDLFWRGFRFCASYTWEDI